MRHTSPLRRLTAAALLTLSTLPVRSADAQSTPARRRVVHEHSWLQLFGEQRISSRWSLLAETQFRRADVAGATPQQLLLRPGVLYDVAPGTRVGGGYLYQWSSVYGEAPAATPAPEHRVWQQLLLSSRTGPVAWSHRFRAEQRWLGQTVAARGGDTEVTGWRFRQRARVFTRATVDAPALGVPLSRAYLTTHGELFAHVGATPEGQVFDQSRLALQGGWRISPAVRVEAGYMQQFIQRGGSRVAENNHTLLVSVFATGR